MRVKARALTAEEMVNIAEIKNLGEKLHMALSACPESREISIAKTRLEEAVMWAVKGITG